MVFWQHKLYLTLKPIFDFVPFLYLYFLETLWILLVEEFFYFLFGEAKFSFFWEWEAKFSKSMDYNVFLTNNLWEKKIRWAWTVPIITSTFTRSKCFKWITLVITVIYTNWLGLKSKFPRIQLLNTHRYSCVTLPT